MIRALDWPEPVYAHVPLIHGPDGAKLSKRHGALGVDAYRDEMGYLPEAVNNYLLRLGWGHGDQEIISRDQAVERVLDDALRQSPAPRRIAAQERAVRPGEAGDEAAQGVRDRLQVGVGQPGRRHDGRRIEPGRIRDPEPDLDHPCF